MTEHFIRPREDWLDPAGPGFTGIENGAGKLYKAPAFLGWDAIDDIVIHYPGADWADPDWADINGDDVIDHSDTIALLRAGHRSYLLGSRGYSYGYGFKIGVVADIWEVRGWEFMNAANLGDVAHGTYRKWNPRSISIQIVVDEADEANAEQVDAVNWLIAEICRQAGRRLNLTWHGAGQYTACCGAGMIGQIQRGVIHLPVEHPTDPTPIPAPGDDDMAMTVFQPSDCKAEFMGLADSRGNAPIIEWIDTAEQQQSRDAYIANGALVDHGERVPGGFRNCTLLGPIPHGDSLYEWTAADFRRVVQ